MIEMRLRKQLHAARGPFRLDVDLRLPTGRIIGLYGPSGAGKTSLLRMLAGLLTPDAGYLQVDETPWLDTQKKINLRPQDRDVGMVFQDYGLFPNMSVAQNLRFALTKGQADNIVDELIEVMELGELRYEYPSTLSGGQRQRVALARSVIQRPRLLLLDEPLAALDRALRLRVRDYLSEVHRTYVPTILLVSHDPAELLELTDWTVVLAQGRVTKQGPSAEVLASEASAKLTLTGTLTRMETTPDGQWLTITHGGNPWRVFDATRRTWRIGQEVEINIDEKRAARADAGKWSE